MLRALFVAGVAVFALLAWRERVPDVEIRYAPRTTQAGRIFPGFALGSGFACENDRLHAIDVAFAPLGGEPQPLEFELRQGTPDGPVVRKARIEAAALPASDDWVRFEFEPLPASAGQRFWFSVAAPERTAHTPWTRYRGIPYVVRPWGDRAIDGPVIEGELLPAPPRPRTDLHHADLNTLAFAMNYVHPQAGEMRLVLYDGKSGEELRRASIGPGLPCDTGWVFFRFQTLPDTRWRALRYRVELPTGASLIGSAEGPSIVAFHGGSRVPDEVLGMTCGTRTLEQRDLVFRAWSSDESSALLARLSTRGGRTILYAGVLWFLALLVASRLLGRSQEADA